MKRMIIELWDDELGELQVAIQSGALADHHNALVAKLRANVGRAEDVDRSITNLNLGAEAVMQAKTKDEHDRKLFEERMPWLKMSSDEWTWASNYMVDNADSELAKGRGGFMTAWLEAQKNLGRAQNRADLGNQAMVRNLCGGVFWMAHMERLSKGPSE